MAIIAKDAIVMEHATLVRVVIILMEVFVHNVLLISIAQLAVMQLSARRVRMVVINKTTIV